MGPQWWHCGADDTLFFVPADEFTDLGLLMGAVTRLTRETTKLRQQVARLPCMRDKTDPNCPHALHEAGDDEPDSVVTRAVSWHAGPLSFRGPGIVGILSFIAGAVTLAVAHRLHLL